MINVYNFYDFICVSTFFSIEARPTVISKKLEIRKCKTEFLSILEMVQIFVGNRKWGNC